MKRILAICLAAAMLTACAETPESILKKEYAKNDDAQNSTVFDGEPEITSLAEMNVSKSDHIEQIKTMKFDNMTISENLTADIPAGVKTGSYICPEGFEDNYVRIFPHYDEDFDEKYAVTDEKYYPTGPVYAPPDKNLEMSIGCTGFFSYMRDPELLGCFHGEVEYIKTYSYLEALNSSDKFRLMLSDDEMSVAEAAEMAQSFADDFVDTADFPNDICLERITLCECEEGYFYKADYMQSASDVNIVTYFSRYRETNENMICPVAFAFLCGGEIKNFAVNNYFDEYEITGKLTETVDMKYAVEFLNETLAEHMELELKRIAFEYQMIYTDNIEEKTDGKETHREKAPWATYCSYDLYKAEPCWVFYFDETPYKEIYAILHCDDMSVDFIDNSR